MSAATDAVRAELEAARRESVAIGTALEDRRAEVKAAIAKRRVALEEQNDNQDRIVALEKALQLLDPKASAA